MSDKVQTLITFCLSYCRHLARCSPVLSVSQVPGSELLLSIWIALLMTSMTGFQMTSDWNDLWTQPRSGNERTVDGLSDWEWAQWITSVDHVDELTMMTSFMMTEWRIRDWRQTEETDLTGSQYWEETERREGWMNRTKIRGAWPDDVQKHTAKPRKIAWQGWLSNRNQGWSLDDRRGTRRWIRRTDDSTQVRFDAQSDHNTEENRKGEQAASGMKD